MTGLRVPANRKAIALLIIVANLTSAIQLTSAVQTNRESTHYRVHLLNTSGPQKGKTVEAEMTLNAQIKQIRLQGKGPDLQIPYDAITNLLYERTAKPRYALGLLVAWPLMFTKSKKHYLTIQFKENESSEFTVVQFDKDDYRNAIALIEAQTGKTVERSEEN